MGLRKHLRGALEASENPLLFQILLPSSSSSSFFSFFLIKMYLCKFKVLESPSFFLSLSSSCSLYLECSHSECACWHFIDFQISAAMSPQRCLPCPPNLRICLLTRENNIVLVLGVVFEPICLSCSFVYLLSVFPKENVTAGAQGLTCIIHCNDSNCAWHIVGAYE